jgi:hypothetical protein
MKASILLISSVFIILFNNYETRQLTPGNCREQKDLWYYEEYLWVHQKVASSKASRITCCNDCFKKSPNCKSWMYDENTHDCYHSSYNYENTAVVKLAGMYTGSY